MNTEVGMGSYTHFTLYERKYLQKLLSLGKSFREIAAILERSPSTISREVNRNRSKTKSKNKSDNPFRYNHWRAQNLYIRRRRGRRFCYAKPKNSPKPNLREAKKKPPKWVVFLSVTQLQLLHCSLLLITSKAPRAEKSEE